MGGFIGRIFGRGGHHHAIATPPVAPPAHVAQPAVPSKTPRQLIDEARQRLGVDCVRHFNFAIVGISGSGKSSLVNALRGLADPPDNGPFPNNLAPVGVVETTAQAKCYTHPIYAHIKLWDMPGAGTPTHPVATYFEDKCLYAFDQLIVATATRFMDVDLKIAQDAVKWNVPVVFLRNKLDVDLNSRKRSSVGTPLALVKSALRAAITDNITQRLQSVALQDRRVFLVTAWAFLDDSIEKFDEEAFATEILVVARARAPLQPA